MVLTISRRLSWLPLLALLLVLGGQAVRSQAIPPQDRKSADKQDKPPAVLSAKPLKIEAGDDELRKLLKERYNAAVAELQARSEELQSGHATLDDLFGAARKVLRSELALSDKPADQVAVREKFLEMAQAVEKVAKTRHQAGKLSDADLAATRYERLDAAVQLLRAKQKAKATPGK